MGEAIGFYFRGMNKEEVTQIRAELNRIAKELGYLAKTGPTMGQGNAAALLVAIAKGEVKITEVKDGEQIPNHSQLNRPLRRVLAHQKMGRDDR